MAEPRVGDRFTCTVGVVKTHFGWFPTDLGPMSVFYNCFVIFKNLPGEPKGTGDPGDLAVLRQLRTTSGEI